MAVLPADQVNAMRRQADLSETLRQNADKAVLQEKRRLSELSRETAGMSADDLREIQKKFDQSNREIQEEVESLREELGKSLGKLTLEYKRSIADISRAAEKNKRDLESLNKEITSLEAKIKKQFDELAQQIQTNRKRALYYYDHLKQTVERISKLFPEKYELLYPDQLQPNYYTLRSSVGSVVEDIEQGNYEVAIGLAQIRLPEAISILGLLEFYHKSFLDADAAAKGAFSKLMDRVKKHDGKKVTTVCINDDIEFDDEYGIAYWVRELYSELKARISETKSRLEACKESNDADGLTMVRRDIDELNEQLSICEQIEENERRLHYECVYKAHMIRRALVRTKQNPWSLDGKIQTNQDDLREPVYMELTRSDGYRATVACIPERSANLTRQGSVRCELDVFDKGTEKDDLAGCRINYDNLALALRSAGIELSPRTALGTTTSSKSFFEGAVNCDEQNRTKWLTAAKKAIGLFEEV